MYTLPLMVPFDWIRCWGHGRSLSNCRSVLGQCVPIKAPWQSNDANYRARKSAFLSFTYIAFLRSVTCNRIITVVMVWSLQSSVSSEDLSTCSTPTGASTKLNLEMLHFCIYTFLKQQTGHFCGRPCCTLHSLWLPITGILSAQPRLCCRWDIWRFWLVWKHIFSAALITSKTDTIMWEQSPQRGTLAAMASITNSWQ